MNDDAIERARERIREAVGGRPSAGDLEATLERARVQLEALAATADELQGALPESVGTAIREGVHDAAAPVARQLAEVRGLQNQVLRRLERLEGTALAERNARIDDLAVLVDLVVSGWKTVDQRLARLEERLQVRNGAVVYRIEERRPTVDAG